MSDTPQEKAIRSLLDESNPADAMAGYYAFHHGREKTQLILSPLTPDTRQADGYVAISRTGLDLFRPLITMRLPISQNLTLSGNLLKEALPSGAEAFISCPLIYGHLVRAFFDILQEEQLLIFTHSGPLPDPIINVLVTRDEANGLPRYVIKREEQGRRVTVAAAGLNWQSPHFAEIAVQTASGYRRQGYGLSVVSSLTREIRQAGRRPIYAVSPQNIPSLDLAKQIGYTDTGYRQLMLTVRRR